VGVQALGVVAGGVRCRSDTGEIVVAADLVIVALPPEPDLSWTQVGDVPLALDEDGLLAVDAETGQTSLERIYACGDLIPGDRSLTGALASGMRVAWGVDRMLRGAEVADRRGPPPRRREWPAPRGLRPPTDTERPPREYPPELDVEERLQSWAEVTGTLTESQARAEAAACAMCGQCGSCRACLDLFGCPAFYLEGGLVHIDPDLCRGCGVCADFCPNRAIRPRVEDAP
jgi:Pyruvate/2-oxoacid:ferredoxin oxidoreductase delta subunit